MKKLLATYARVSTTLQEQQETIKNQIDVLREFANKNGYVIVQEYTDDGWSGDILARPALDQLREDAKKKIWDTVLFYDPDRLARRYSFQELVMDELRETGIEILFITTPSPKTGEEKILHGVRGLFAEYERVKITERFRLGKLRKVREGNVLVSEAPYGYNYIPRNGMRHGYFEVDEAEARVVKMIFSWVANEGFTVRGVIRKLKELGIKPRKSERGIWAGSTVKTMLRRETYIGKATYGKSQAIVPENPQKLEKYKKIKKTSKKIRPREEWIYIPAPAILETDLFEHAQKQLKENAVLAVRNKKYEYLLTSRIWCVCGRRRHGGSYFKGQYMFYRCSSRISSFPFLPDCREGVVNTKIADKLVWTELKKLMSSPNLLKQQTNRWIKDQKKKVGTSKVDLVVIENNISKLKTEEARYHKAYGAGLLSIEQLKEYVGGVQERVRSLESQKLDTDSRDDSSGASLMLQEGDLEAFSRKAGKVLDDLNFEAKQAIVRNILDKVVATPRELIVSGYIPVERDSNYEFKTIHRPHRFPAKKTGVEMIEQRIHKTKWYKFLSESKHLSQFIYHLKTRSHSMPQKICMVCCNQVSLPLKKVSCLHNPESIFHKPFPIKTSFLSPFLMTKM